MAHSAPSKRVLKERAQLLEVHNAVKSGEAARNYKHAYLSGLYEGPYIETFITRWTGPMLIECDCGRHLETPDFTNECERCGRLWN